jgi:hypothetical protein
VRYGLRGLRQARRDSAAHAVERYFLVAAGFIERFDFRGGGRRSDGRRRTRRARCIGNIARDDAAAWP